MEIGKFTELEDKIRLIVSDQIFLKKQISTLEEALKNKELEIEGYKSNLTELEAERTGVRERVDTMLELLADIQVEKEVSGM